MFTTADDLDDGLLYNVYSYDGATDADLLEVAEVPVSKGDGGDELPEPRKEDVITNKRPASVSKLQEKKKVKMEIDVDRKKAIATETSVEAIADYVNEQLRRKNPNLSALELSEIYFKKTDFRSSSEFTEPRTVENLSKFILARFKNMLPTSTPGKKNNNKDKKRGRKTNKKEFPDGGSVELLNCGQDRKFIAVFSMSALRVCDVHRTLSDIPGSSLKLINKNKLDLDLKLIRGTWSRVLCCTPGRLQKVLEAKDLPLNRNEIKIVIVDNSHLDQKMQNVFNINETSDCLKELTSVGAKIYLF